MGETETDQALWERVGGAEAFGTLFERHWHAVYRFCFWRTGEAGLAEDLSAAVFLEAWRHRGRVVAVDGSMLPWLLRVAANLVRNQRRSQRRRQRALRRLPELPPEPDIADDVTARLDAEASMRVVLALVRELPEREQELLALCVWMGCSYQEAATIVGIPVGTVRSRLAKARARLRQLVGEASAPDEPGCEAVNTTPQPGAEGGSS